MRILHLTSHLNVGGITRYILSLSKNLVEQGHSVVIASDHGSAESHLKALGVTHWRCPFHTSVEFSPQVFAGMQWLIRRLREEPVDLIHAHTRVGQIVAEVISHQLKIPYVTTWHGIYKPRLGRRLWPCVGELSIAISSPVCQQLREDFHVPENRIRRIYNGIDTDHYAVSPDPLAIEAYRRHWQIPAHQTLIGGIGRLAAGKVKGFDSLLTVAYLLKEKFPDLQVLIVGDGPRRPFLEDIARRLGIKQSVHFVGEAEDIRVPLALMDVFVFFSRWPEAFGLTLVEAMAAGKPAVATKVGAVPEIIQDGINGWMVSSDDPVSMAERIAQLLSDRVMAKQFGLQAQIRVRSAFGLKRMAVEVEAVYREVVELASLARLSPKIKPES